MPRLRGARHPLPNSLCVGDHKAYGELYIFFAFCVHTDKTISVQWGTTTIMVSCRVHMYMHRRSKGGSEAASRIAMRGLKLGNFCIASFCVLACFYVISHRVVGEGAVTCLVCMYSVRCFVRVAWTHQVLPAACMHACKTHAYVPTYCLTALRVIQPIFNNSITDVLFESV